MKQRGTGLKEDGTGERNRREGGNAGRADETERGIRKADLDREGGGGDWRWRWRARESAGKGSGN